jgi:transposase-like protein
VEENIEQTLTCFCLLRQHHKHLNSINMLEQLNEEIRRRTMSCASSPTRQAACGWCGHPLLKPTKTGWKRAAAQKLTLSQPHNAQFLNLTHITKADCCGAG